MQHVLGLLEPIGPTTVEGIYKVHTLMIAQSDGLWMMGVPWVITLGIALATLSMRASLLARTFPMGMASMICTEMSPNGVTMATRQHIQTHQLQITYRYLLEMQESYVVVLGKIHHKNKGLGIETPNPLCTECQQWAFVSHAATST